MDQTDDSFLRDLEELATILEVVDTPDNVAAVYSSPIDTSLEVQQRHHHQNQAIEKNQSYIDKINVLCNSTINHVSAVTDFYIYNYLDITTDIYSSMEYKGHKILFLVRSYGTNKQNSVEFYLSVIKSHYTMNDKLAINWTVFISLLDAKNGSKEVAYTMSMIVENVYTNTLHGIDFCNKDKIPMFIDSNNNLLMRICIRDNNNNNK
jgi:hypothetical protein